MKICGIKFLQIFSKVKKVALVYIIFYKLLIRTKAWIRLGYLLSKKISGTVFKLEKCQIL